MRILFDFLGIALGSAIFALGTQGLVVAANLGGGGVSGIAILAYYLVAFPISLTTIILNIPLVIIGWREIGRSFIIRTAFGVLVSSLFLQLFKGVNLVPYGDVLMGALYGGIVQGIGGALVLRSEGSLGGGDIVAKILQKRYGFSIGNVGLVINLAVLLMSLAVLGSFKVMYTLIALYVSSKVIDAVLEGMPAKSATIITRRGDEIAEHIIKEVHRGVTLLPGRGGYTHGDKAVLMCVVSLTELVRVKRLVKELDPQAFVIVGEAKEVLGKGFRELS